MSRFPSIPWLRISAEGAVIVVSILLAFAIDAWWQERLDRISESELLDRLHAEFTSNVDRITEYDTRLTSGQRATQQLFSLVQEGSKSGLTSIDVPELLIQRMLDAPTVEPETPVFDSLIRSGQQVLLRDRRVISSLATWERSFQNYAELAFRTRENMDAHLVPALARRGNIGNTMMSTIPVNALHELEVDPENTVEVEIDEEFGSLLAERYRNGWRGLSALSRARDMAKGVVEAIEAAKSE